MSRLVKTDLASAGQSNARTDSPVSFHWRRAVHAFAFQRPEHSTQIITHQIEKASQYGMFCMHLHKFAITRMNRQLGRRQRKYQPIVAEIDRGEFQHGFEERTIGFRVLAIEKKMRSGNHCGSILTSLEMNSLNNAPALKH